MITDRIDQITAFFSAASETGRDLADDYIETPAGSLQTHKFVKHSTHGEDFETLPKTSEDKEILYVVEVFVDDCIVVAIPTSQEQLAHVATAVTPGIHDVFPADTVDENDAISVKK